MCLVAGVGLLALTETGWAFILLFGFVAVGIRPRPDEGVTVFPPGGVGGTTGS